MVSFSVTSPSHANATNNRMLELYNIQSLVIGHQSNCTGYWKWRVSINSCLAGNHHQWNGRLIVRNALPPRRLLTFRVARDATAATPSVLNISEPIIVPKPISDSVINVLITLVKNSGVVVAVAMNVAAATSLKNTKKKQNCYINQ